MLVDVLVQLLEKKMAAGWALRLAE